MFEDWRGVFEDRGGPFVGFEVKDLEFRCFFVGSVMREYDEVILVKNALVFFGVRRRVGFG